MLPRLRHARLTPYDTLIRMRRYGAIDFRCLMLFRLMLFHAFACYSCLRHYDATPMIDMPPTLAAPPLLRHADARFACRHLLSAAS